MKFVIEKNERNPDKKHPGPDLSTTNPHGLTETSTRDPAVGDERLSLDILFF